MKLTAAELARLDAMTDMGLAPPPAPPGVGEGPTTIAMLIDHRRRRLARR